MCLLFVALNQHRHWPFICASNRDEFHARATAPAQQWGPDFGGAIGGRDLQAGGSWLLLSPLGRLAALTNVRGVATPANADSRGGLVSGFIQSSDDGESYAAKIGHSGERYAGFNLLSGRYTAGQWQLHHSTNCGRGAAQIGSGIHGLSNANFNTPWPKLNSGKAELQRLLSATVNQPQIEQQLFSLLADAQQADTKQLPNTGVTKDIERLLSSRFIKSDDYGTRASTLIMTDRHGCTVFIERRFNAKGENCGDSRFELQLK